MLASKIMTNHPQVCEGDQSKIQLPMHRQAVNVNTMSYPLAFNDMNQATSIKVKEKKS